MCFCFEGDEEDILLDCGILVLLVLAGLIFLGYAFSEAGKTYFFMIPVSVEVSATNFEISPASSPVAEPDIIILTYNNTPSDVVPENCYTDNYLFSLFEIKEQSTGKVVGETRFSRESKGVKIQGVYPSTESFDGFIPVLEPENKKGTLRKLLGKDTADLKLSFKLIPFTQESFINKNNAEEFGCWPVWKKIIEDELELSGELNGVKDYPQDLTLCVKEYGVLSNGILDDSSEECTFFNIKSNIKIKTNVNLDEGYEFFNQRPIV